MKRTAILVIVAIVIVAGVATAVLLLTRDRSLARLQEEDTIRIGYAVEAPYSFLTEAGEITGESPEIAKVVAERLGIHKIEWVLTEFGSLISGLEAGRFDVIAAGMFVTPERAERVAFSEPTFHVLEGLLVLKGNPKDLHSYRQAIAAPDVRIAVLTGAVEAKLLWEMGLPAFRTVEVPDVLTGRTAVESGLADGLALSSPTFRWVEMCGDIGSTASAEPFEQPELATKQMLGYGAFAFRRGEGRLLSAWNEVLLEYIGSPEHLALVSAFGFTTSELPEGVTTRDILSSK